MGDTALNVPIKVRTHELQQVHEMVPLVRDDLANAELDDAAEEVARIYEEHIEGIEPTDAETFAAHLSMPAEDWRKTIRYLNRAKRSEGRLRVYWLQTKLVTRLEDRLEQMEDD